MRAVKLTMLLAVCLTGCFPDEVVLGGDRDAAMEAGLEDGGPMDAAVDAGPAGEVSVSPESLSFVHVVGVSPCPQPVGSIILTNDTDASVGWTAAPLPRWLLVRPTSGTLAPSESAVVDVEFTCDVPEIPFLFTTPVDITHDLGNASISVMGDVRAM